MSRPTVERDTETSIMVLDVSCHDSGPHRRSWSTRVRVQVVTSKIERKVLNCGTLKMYFPILLICGDPGARYQRCGRVAFVRQGSSKDNGGRLLKNGL